MLCSKSAFMCLCVQKNWCTSDVICVYCVWCAFVVYHFLWFHVCYCVSSSPVMFLLRRWWWCHFLNMQNIINIYQFIIISLANSTSVLRTTDGPKSTNRRLFVHVCSMATIHKMSACNLVNPSCKYAIDIMRYENEKKSKRGKKYHTRQTNGSANQKHFICGKSRNHWKRPVI